MAKGPRLGTGFHMKVHNLEKDSCWACGVINLKTTGAGNMVGLMPYKLVFAVLQMIVFISMVWIGSVGQLFRKPVQETYVGTILSLSAMVIYKTSGCYSK